MSIYFKYDSTKGCPKCGYLDTRDRYCGIFNTIERQCTRCLYKWKELPMDAQVDVEHVPYLEQPQPTAPTEPGQGQEGNGE